MSQTVVASLNRQIANWTVLFVKLHNFHWYVKGDQFFTLHLKFEELYGQATLHIDDLAERVLALGGKPVARMTDCLEQASVREATGDETAQQMVEAVVADYRTLVGELKDGMKLAQDQGDETTADMFLALHTELEKHVWMLSSFLGK